MLSSLRKNGLTSLFKEVRVFKVGGALKRLRSAISRKRRIFPIFQKPLNGRVF